VSADNWTSCPACEEKHDAELLKRGAELQASYGKVSVEEFDALRRTFKAFASKRHADSFREDYEMGVHAGEFFVDYHGECQDCGFSHTFEHRELLQVPK
jgi:hypothetical protein